MSQKIFTQLFEIITEAKITQQDREQSQQELWAVSASILHSLLNGETQPLMNSLVIGTHVPIGSRVLGTKWVVDPAQATFQHALLMSWDNGCHDYYHSNKFLLVWAATLSMADYLSRKRLVRGQSIITIKEVLELIARLRKLHIHMDRVWPDARYSRWKMKLLSGAACLILMNKSHHHLCSLWSHITLQGFSMPYADNKRKEAAWGVGLDLHQTVMAAYSVVQTEQHFCIDLADYIDTSDALKVLNSSEQGNIDPLLRERLNTLIQSAKIHPDIGHCKSLLELSNPSVWDRSISWLLSQCSLSI